MAKKGAGSTGDGTVFHYGAIRLRATGSGNLQMTLFSRNEVRSQVLVALALPATTDIDLNRLANFTQQRAKLQISTANINETFNINKIIIFTRPVASSLPGN